jgi:hypothetical protein
MQLATKLTRMNPDDMHFIADDFDWGGQTI